MFVFYAYFILLFLFSALYLTSGFNSIGNVMISIMILAVVLIVLMFKKRDFKISLYSLIMMFLFMLASTTSALINSDISLIVTSSVIVALYFSAFIIMPSFNIDINEVVYKTIMISHIPIIIIPLALWGLNTNPYRGIFYNPNSFGSIATTLFALVFGLFLFKLENYYTKKSKQRQTFINLFAYILILSFVFFLIVASGSRSSSLTATVLVLLGVFLVMIRLVKNKRIAPFIKSVFFGAFVIFSIVVIAKITPLYDYLYQNIIYKFQIKSDDLLDNRGIVWEQTIKEAGLFGKGSDFFVTQTFTSAHNTFISILGEYGWFPLIIFMIIMVYGFFSSLKYALSGVLDKYKYMPILLVVCFTTLSMGENMLFKLSMLAMFFAMGSTVKLKTRLKDFNNRKETGLVKNKKRRLVKYRFTW